MIVLKPRDPIELVAAPAPRRLDKDPDFGIETDLHRHRAPGVHLVEPKPPPDAASE